MSQKKKGSNAEREIIHLFHQHEGWGAVRVAGSGSNHYPSPDIVAGSVNEGRYIAVECKATRKGKQYLEKEEIEQLRVFASNFGAEAWVAIRFLNNPWYFLKPEQLDDVGKAVGISLVRAQNEGLQFHQLIRGK